MSIILDGRGGDDGGERWRLRRDVAASSRGERSVLAGEGEGERIGEGEGEGERAGERGGDWGCSLPEIGMIKLLSLVYE